MQKKVSAVKGGSNVTPFCYIMIVQKFLNPSTAGG